MPAQPRGKLTLTVRNMPAGTYTVSVYRIGYRINDPFETYRDLGSPSQLTRPQVAAIQSKNSGAPVSVFAVTLAEKATFSRTFPLRTNDVFLVTLRKTRTAR